tara:strand:+ start:1505 stop:1762 length:258 start_codon:yes stop_codon:yes gene_type:complete
MNYQELSKQYSICCEEIQRTTAMLYEEIHDLRGNPVKDWEKIIDKITKYRQGVKAETDHIILMCQKYNETLLKNEINAVKEYEKS